MPAWGKKRAVVFGLSCLAKPRSWLLLHSGSERPNESMERLRIYFSASECHAILLVLIKEASNAGHLNRIAAEE